MKNNPKIAIIHSDLVHQGGIERTILLMAKTFNADVIVGKYDPEKTFDGFKTVNVIPILKGNYPQRLKSLMIRHKFKKLRLDYDFYILHGGASLELAKHHKPNLWYCHSPTKWLYQLYKEEVKKYPIYLRPLFILYCKYLKIIDKRNVKHVDTIVANSENIKQTVKKEYNRDGEIVNPPVDINKFKFIMSGQFYLSTARLSPDKRVDIIVKAFQKMPDKQLVVVSSGSEAEKLKKMSREYNNIIVGGRISDNGLAGLYGCCIATICASRHEDFGMIAPESMSAGKPVIAVGDMGFAESIIPWKTGIFYSGGVRSLINAVKKLTPKKAQSMRKACEERAKDFSEENYIRKLKKAME